VVIDTDPYPSTEHGGTWWEVAIPEVSDRDSVKDVRLAYEDALQRRLQN
jgi:3D-(3,5/4)-trihydroxycyclohexane-1,2-dione acylhydrolase (decyclizing)